MDGQAKHSVVRALRTGLALIFALAVLNATAGAQLLFTDQQSGWVLKPKQLEVGGAFSSVNLNYSDGGSNHAWNIYGLNLGYGLAKSVELRVRYGFFDPKYGSGASALSFGPKFGLFKNILALYVPVELLFGEDVDVAETWNIQPGVIASFPVGKRLEITPSVKALIPLSNTEDRETLMAVNLGLGIFAMAERNLVIRPEIGVLFNPGDSGNYLQFSIGLSYCTKPRT